MSASPPAFCVPSRAIFPDHLVPLLLCLGMVTAPLGRRRVEGMSDTGSGGVLGSASSGEGGHYTGESQTHPSQQRPPELPLGPHLTYPKFKSQSVPRSYKMSSVRGLESTGLWPKAHTHQRTVWHPPNRTALRPHCTPG